MALPLLALDAPVTTSTSPGLGCRGVGTVIQNQAIEFNLPDSGPSTAAAPEVEHAEVVADHLVTGGSGRPRAAGDLQGDGSGDTLQISAAPSVATPVATEVGPDDAFSRPGARLLPGRSAAALEFVEQLAAEPLRLAARSS